MKDLYHAILRKGAHFQVEHPYLTVLLLFMMTVAIYGGVSKVKTVASLEQMMPRDVAEIKAFNVLRDNAMGQDIIAIIVEVDPESTDTVGVIDIRDKRVYDYVEKIKASLQAEPDILETYAFTDIVGRIDDDSDYQENLLKNKDMLTSYINSDFTKTMIIATTDVSADDSRMDLLSTRVKQTIADSGMPGGIRIKLTGTPIIQQRLGELISRDRSSTQWISTILVFLITMLIFGTVTSALVPIIIVSASVSWLYGTMGYTGLPISTLAGGVAAMVIGIGIDFAIHIMNKFKLERKRGINVKKSIEEAVVETGTALTATSVTTIVAFLAFLAGTMPEMGRFGILMAIGITYSLIFSLFGLPALLIIEERVIYRFKKKFKFGVEGEFHLEGGKDACEKK